MTNTDQAVPLNQLVSFEEIGEMLGVQKSTVWAWSSRGKMPDPAVVVSGHSLWTRTEIEQWASQTGKTITY